MFVSNSHNLFSDYYVKNKISTTIPHSCNNTDKQDFKSYLLSQEQANVLKAQCLSFSSKAVVKEREFESKEGEKVVFKNDKAVLKDNNKLFTGSIYFEDKKGNYWELEYKEGKIKQSFKNYRIYKMYQTYENSRDEKGDIIESNTMLSDAYSKDPYILGYEELKDGSRIPKAELYGYEDPTVTEIFLEDGMLSITKNPHPKFKGEPVILVEKSDSDGESRFTYENPTGEDVVVFQSMNKAKEYFKNEYGIDIEVDTLAQAQIIKLAVDDFVKIYNDKKCLKGLRFETSEVKGANAGFRFDFEDILFDSEEQNSTFKNLKTVEERIRFARENKPNHVVIKNPKIQLNKGNDWNNLDKENLKTGLLKVFSAYTLKGTISHEIGHYLHLKNNIEKFLDEQKPGSIAQQVSRYSTDDSAELVAEYIAGKLEGKKYSKEINELYLEYGGPDIFTKI